MKHLRTKTFHIEQLESRLALAAEAVGTPALVNDFVIRDQSTVHSAQAIAASVVNQVVVFEGHGPNDRQGVFAEIRNATGTTTVASFQVNTTLEGRQYAPSVAVEADGDFIVVWAGRGAGDKSGIYFQRFTAAGARVGNETLVNTTTGGQQTSPVVAVAGDGSFAIGWSGVGTGDFSGVFLRRYNSSGVASGNETRINTTTTNDQAMPDLAFDATGNLFAVWASRDQDGSDWGIYAQRYNTTGGALGTEFVMNSTTSNSQMNPDLAIDPTGGFLVAWQSFGQDTSGWGVVGRRFTTAGATDGAEFVLNNDTAGHQKDVSVAFSTDGKLFSTWTTGIENGNGWEIVARLYNATGTADGNSFLVNQATSGANSGLQYSPSVVAVGDDATIVWSGRGAADPDGVFAQRYNINAASTTPQAPNLAAIDDRQATAGTQLEVTVTATDQNANDILTFTLDPDNSPPGATITQTNNNTAVVRWTPTSANQGTTVSFRVIVTDNGNPALSDSEEFDVTVAAAGITIDLSGPDETGNNNSATFVAGGGAVNIVDSDATVTFPTGTTITEMRAQLAAAPNGTQEFLSVDTLNTQLQTVYTSSTRTLRIIGTDTPENYARVLRTVKYNNLASGASGSRSVSVTAVSGSINSNTATASIEFASPNLVAFAQALTAAGARLFGAAWNAETTEQKELFDDGAQFLQFVESTNPNRTPNQAATTNNVTTYPTWIFQDGSRLVGVQTLQALAEHADIDIPLSTSPFVAPISNTTLLIGSPLHIPLDGYDPNGGTLTYTVTTNNSGVTATVLTGNRSARMSVEGYGDMVFELFEDRASRATSRMIELAEDDFYEGIIFHRNIENFVIQGGDPTGTGSGGSQLPNFDDQFHPDLQHNQTGLLSMAKTSDDTNDSQFFITEGSQRHLDFNHTIFGVMVEGESVREAINDAPVDDDDKPLIDIAMEGIEIFNDQENAVVMLKAAAGTTGTVSVTVKVTDENGNFSERVFQVTVASDTSNSPPYLTDIGPVSANRNTTAQIQLSSIDVEGDSVIYTAQNMSGDSGHTVSVSAAGLVQVTPKANFTGTVDVLVQVKATASSTQIDSQLISVQFT